MMWKLNKLVRNVHNPHWWRETALPYIKRRVGNQVWTINALYYDLVNRSSWNIMEEDWDTLFLMDACRYDLWESADTPWDPSGHRISPNSYTVGFLQETFSNRKYPDTVYVTANPQAHIHLDSLFHREINVWDWGWNDELGTVKPEVIAEAVREAHETYPHKRILAHFMQPHFPFIGPCGRELTHRGYANTRAIAKGNDGKETISTIWDLLADEVISEKKVWNAYRENLEIALSEVEALSEGIDGKITISSDHGNLIGERMFPIPMKGYGHPPDVQKTELVKVPWIEINQGQRRKVVDGSISKTKRQPPTDVHSRLSQLGYVE